MTRTSRPSPARQTPNLRAAALNGARWRLVEAFGLQISTLLSTLVLARFLTAEEFAIIAAANIVLSFLALMADVGISQSLIQDHNPTDTDYSTFAWFGLGLGVSLAAAGIAMAPTASTLLGMPSLTPYVRIVLLSLPLSLVSPVPRAMLIRDLRFRGVTLIDLSSALVYLAAAIVLVAVFDFAAWSVIVAKLVQTAWRTLWMFIACRWIPSFLFSLPSLRRRVGYNGGVFLGTSVNYFVKNADYWVVSRFFSSGALGYYYIAFVLPNIMRQRVTSTVQSVTFAIGSRVQNDRARLQRVYREGLRLTLFVIAPILVALSIASEHVIAVVFGSRWAAASAPMTWLALSSLLVSILPSGHAVLLARGRVRAALFDRLVALAVFAALIPWMAAGDFVTVAVGVLFSSLAGVLYHWIAVRRELGLSLRHLYADHRMTVVATALMAAIMSGVETSTILAQSADILQLASLTVVGAVSYILISLVVDRAAFLAISRQLLSVVAPQFSRSKAANVAARTGERL